LIQPPTLPSSMCVNPSRSRSARMDAARVLMALPGL
jgi:hypothetical protein